MKLKVDAYYLLCDLSDKQRLEMIVEMIYLAADPQEFMAKLSDKMQKMEVD